MLLCGRTTFAAGPAYRIISRLDCGLRPRGSRPGGAVASRSPLEASVRSRVLARRLLRAPPLDALLALGTDLYDLRTCTICGRSCTIFYRSSPTTTTTVRSRYSCVIPSQTHGESGFRRRRFGGGLPGRRLRLGGRCLLREHAVGGRVIDERLWSPRPKGVSSAIGHRPRRSPSHRDWSSPKLLFVGVDCQRKNGDRVLRAFARFVPRTEGPMPPRGTPRQQGQTSPGARTQLPARTEHPTLVARQGSRAWSP